MSECYNKICIVWAILWMFLMVLGDMLIAFVLFNAPTGQTSLVFSLLGIVGWPILCIVSWIFTGIYVHKRWVGN